MKHIWAKWCGYKRLLNEVAHDLPLQMKLDPNLPSSIILIKGFKELKIVFSKMLWRNRGIEFGFGIQSNSLKLSYIVHINWNPNDLRHIHTHSSYTHRSHPYSYSSYATLHNKRKRGWRLKKVLLLIVRPVLRCVYFIIHIHLCLCLFLPTSLPFLYFDQQK